MPEKVNLNAYFERIGFAGSIAPTLPTLEAIQALHAVAIPFENIDAVMGRPIRLDQASLEQKMLLKGRGGYCFEQNTLLLNVLRDLDFTARAYAARILWQMPEGGARMISHMLVVVDIAGASYLCDVGMSSFRLTAPLKLRDGAEQTVGTDIFALRKEDNGWRLELKSGEHWLGVYRFDLVEQSEADIAALSAQIEAEYFRLPLLYAARLDNGVRVSLTNNRLSIRRPDEPRERHFAPDVETLKTMLIERFGIILPSADELDPALARVIENAPAQEPPEQEPSDEAAD